MNDEQTSEIYCKDMPFFLVFQILSTTNRLKNVNFQPVLLLEFGMLLALLLQSVVFFECDPHERSVLGGVNA